MAHPSGSQDFWRRRSSLLAWQINAAAWLERTTPVLFFVVCPFAVALYALRRVRIPVDMAAALLVGSVLLTAAICWWVARRQFFTRDDARVLLEAQLRLDTRLTAADSNLVNWPAIPKTLPAVVRWRPRVPLAWMAGSTLMLALALLAPVPAAQDGTIALGPPPAIVQTEALIEALKQVNVADPQALENLSERAQELARRPSTEQYTHSALEAADALRDQALAATAGLARDLDNASKALNPDSSDMEGAAGQLAAAISGLRDGAMPANKELLSQLPANAGELKKLTREQREQLAKQLASASQCVGGVNGAAGANARVAQPGAAVPNWWLDPNHGQGGKGGGAHAPLALSSEQSDAGAGKSEGLNGQSLKNFALGDKLGTSAGAHDVDTATLLGQVSAGTVATPASGGEAAWVNRLTPAERAALKEFFK